MQHSGSWLLRTHSKVQHRAIEAANACLQYHGGFGFAAECDVERKFRETRLYQMAPISTNLIPSYVGEHILGMPRSFRQILSVVSWTLGPAVGQVPILRLRPGPNIHMSRTGARFGKSRRSTPFTLVC